MDGIPLVFLIPCMITDLKRQKVSLVWVGLWEAAGFFYQIIVKEEGIIDLFWASLVGIIVLLIAKLFQQCIGYGDGAVLCVLGIWIGFWDTLFVLFLALMTSSIKAIFLILIKKKKKTYRIPFVPFITVSYLILWVLGGK